MKKYDIIIIGAGPGGYVAAIKAAQMGAKVLLIEKESLGGVCLNFGCIPTKALIKSAKIYRNIIDSNKYGITLDHNTVKADWPAIIKRKDDIVKRLTSGVETLLTKNGVEIIKGEAKVINRNQVEVNNLIVEAKNLVLATGSSPVIPPIPGIKEAFEKGIILTSKELLDSKVLPKSLLIIGGGVIGVEFATIFSTFGTKVTIIEMMDNILSNIDSEARALIGRILKRNKVEIITSAKVVKFDSNKVVYEKDGINTEISSEKILLSVGMRANTLPFQDLMLEMEKGAIITNQKLQTSIPNIYAIGDVNGKMMLAHVASHEGIVAVENIMGKDSKIDYSKIPSGIYGFPEIAMVGLTEDQAKEQNLDYQVGKFPLAALGKAIADGETDGFVKIISDKKYGEILGITIIAENAIEMISEGTITMELEGTVHEISKTVHPHPSLSEAIMETAMATIHKPIHIIDRKK